jgi:hypothetical protein
MELGTLRTCARVVRARARAVRAKNNPPASAVIDNMGLGFYGYRVATAVERERERELLGRLAEPRRGQGEGVGRDPVRARRLASAVQCHPLSARRVGATADPAKGKPASSTTLRWVAMPSEVRSASARRMRGW